MNDGISEPQSFVKKTEMHQAGIQSEEWPRVSIVVLNFNGLEHLNRCLTSLRSLNYPNFEVIFVDNASRDRSVEFVKEKFGSFVRLIVNKRNCGFAEGNNIGISHSTGKYIAILSNDTEVNGDWLKYLIPIMEEDEEVCACRGKLLDYHSRPILQGAWDIVDMFGSHRIIGFGEVDRGQYDEVKEVFFTSGCAMVLRKSALDRVGLFDPSFFMYQEEVDLCWRLHLAGYKCIYIPEAIVYHKGGGTASKISRDRPAICAWLNFHSSKNQTRMLLKNYSLSNLVKVLPVHLSIRILDAVGFILVRKWRQGLSIISSMLWNLRHLRDTLEHRWMIQRHIRKVSDEQALKLMAPATLTIELLKWRLKRFQGSLKKFHIVCKP